MSYQDQLYEFLEDELPVEQETGLFTELASNAELRTEMKDVLSMQRAVGVDTRAFAVPATSVQSVFSSLGYMAPAAAGAGAATGFLAFMKSGYGIVAASLMGALVTTASFFGLGGTFESELQPTPAQQVPVVAAAQSAPIELEITLPAPEPIVVPQSQPTVAQTSMPQVSQVPLTSDNSNALFVEDERNSDVMTEEATAAHLQGAAAEDNVVASFNSILVDRAQPVSAWGSVVDEVAATGDQRVSSAPTYNLPKTFFPSPSYFVFEMRQMTTWSLDNPDVSPQANAGPANFAVSLGIPTAEESRVVLDFGRESFYMNFTQHLDNGGTVVHRKNPLMWWGGVGYRHIFNPQGTVQPFVQGIVGAAEAGPMGRMMIGTEVSLSTSIKLFGALEGSSLFYSLDGSDYWSTNMGLVYGLSLNF